MAADHIDTLTSIALVTTAALLCGLALIRLRQPAIVGYILAGVALGPTGLKLVSNTETVQVLAELGVIMLLFLIGMELSLRSFKSVYKTALSVAALQIVAALAVFYGIGHFLEWTTERIVVFAFATALSSTAVAIKILEETDELRTPVGRTTVSVLIAQDLAVIPMLLIIGAFGSGQGGMMGAQATTAAIAVKLAIAIGILIAVSLFLSKRDRVELPMSGWIMSRHEVIPLAALAFCFTWATLSGLIGLSTAYGAFLAGLIIGNSNVRATMHKAAEPIQTILLMVFFLSIGLLINLDYIFANWKNVLLVLAIVTFLKTIVNVGILHLLGEPWRRAFHAGVVMGQMGEFSFIIVAGGVTAKIITPEGYDLMISVIALSLLISPMWLAVARRLHDMAIRKLGVNILTPAQDE
ncbi:MAG: cation:proton antiporter [Alphaproteobacteria bacterium]|nr:cation:proton antiporter [Alphaproteobacteria bacterium]